MSLLDEPFAPEKAGFSADVIGIYHDRKITEELWASFAYYKATDSTHRFVMTHNSNGEKMTRTLPRMNTVRDFYEYTATISYREWEQPFPAHMRGEYRNHLIDEILKDL